MPKSTSYLEGGGFVSMQDFNIFPFFFLVNITFIKKKKKHTLQRRCQNIQQKRIEFRLIQNNYFARNKAESI